MTSEGFVTLNWSLKLVRCPRSLAATHRSFALIARTAQCLRQLPWLHFRLSARFPFSRILCRESLRPILAVPPPIRGVPDSAYSDFRPSTLKARPLLHPRYGLRQRFAVHSPILGLRLGTFDERFEARPTRIVTAASSTGSCVESEDRGRTEPEHLCRNCSNNPCLAILRLPLLPLLI